MFSFFVKNQSIYIFKPMESFLKLLLHIIAFIWALNNFDHAKARFLPSSDGPWSSCNAQKGKIFMENECKQLLLCYRSNLTNGNAKKAQNFGQSKIYKNGTHQFKECAKVMAKGKQWHGLIITRDGPDTLRLESSLGFDGVFDAVQMNNSEKVTEIDMLKINEQLERELQKELNVGTFFDDFRENVLAFDFVSPLYGKNDTTKWCQTKCLSQLSERQTMIAPQRKAFRFNWWALPDGIPPLDCARLFGNDQTYIAQMVKQRIRRKDEPAEHALDMSCEAIRNRNRFWHETEDGKDNYPLAQIRIVYKDYVLVELDLAATFSPLNWYCYVIDSMATELFKRRVHALAYCFSNVIVADERRVDNSGAGMMEAVLDCFGRLVTAQRKWEYVTLLQNHDTAIKTHVQMAQIFAWMEGANDVLETVPPNDRHDNIEHMDWSFAALNLFQNASRNSAVSAAAVADGHPAHLQLSKGAFQVSLCRAMVEFILRELNLTEFVRRINLIGYGQDETMLVTLHTADQLNAPGGFTQTCRNPKNAGPTNYLTREVLWKQPYMSCSTGFWRHSVCVFGIEDLARLTTLPHLFFNKFWPPFDFGATLCMYERLFNMTHLHTAKEQLDNMAPVVNKTVVQQLPNVRFQLFKKYMLLKPKRPNSDHLLTFDEVMQFRCPDKEKFWILFWRAIKDSPGNGIIIFAMASVTEKFFHLCMNFKFKYLAKFGTHQDNDGDVIY